jgi:hypothetical protein
MMKAFAKLSVLIGCLLISVNVFGGSGAGGSGWSKTRLLLQSFAHSEAVLTVEGMTSLPENDTTPLLKIPSDEYKFFSDEVCRLSAGGVDESFVLPPVELADGSVRTFVLSYAGIPCKEPILLRLDEVTAKTEKDAE